MFWIITIGIGIKCLLAQTHLISDFRKKISVPFGSLILKQPEMKQFINYQSHNSCTWIFNFQRSLVIIKLFYPCEREQTGLLLILFSIFGIKHHTQCVLYCNAVDILMQPVKLCLLIMIVLDQTKKSRYLHYKVHE